MLGNERPQHRYLLICLFLFFLSVSHDRKLHFYRVIQTAHKYLGNLLRLEIETEPIQVRLFVR